jgi:hypothetical protein
VLPLLVAVATACSASRNASTVVSPDPPLSAVSGTSPGTPGPATAGSGAAAATSGDATAGVDANLVKDGYRVVKRHDQVLYCRSESVTGTLFASTVCLTASQIASQKRDLLESKDLLKQAGAARCAGPECVGK